MRLLAFDTALDGCSVGIFADARPLALRVGDGRLGHGEQLPLLLADLLAAEKLDLRDLDALAVTVGPGTFSGIRTGLAAARGLSLASGLPIFGVTTLAALAAPLLQQADDQRPIAAIVDARRGQVYMQYFAGPAAASPPAELTSPKAAAAKLAAPVRLAGNGAALLQPFLADLAGVELVEAPLDAPAVASAASLAAARGVRPVAGTSVAPAYLRNADAQPNAGRALLADEA